MNIYMRQVSKLLFGLLAVVVFCKAVPSSFFFEAGNSLEPIAQASIAQNEGRHPQAASEPVTRPIEQIRVGHRVIAHNPNISASERSQWSEPEWDTWKYARLEMTKADGSILDIELIRPESWFQPHRVATSGHIQLDLPEMGAQGAARVVSVGNCPPIEAGQGRVVTATFTHPPSTTVLDVGFEATSSTEGKKTELISVTDNHLFWSADRLKFLPIGKMRIGERVQTYFGETKRLASKLP